MKKKSGYTLIELIVTVAIMGVLLIVALPQVSNLSKIFKDYKYNSYYKSLERAAKLYVDNNSKEMFGNFNSGCAVIEYNTLESANLIKDFTESKVVRNNTYVAVTKINNEFEYATNLELQDGYKKPETSVDRNTCQMKEDTTGPTVSVDPLYFDDTTTSNAPSIRISLHDNDIGFKGLIKLKYKWVKQNTNPDNTSWITADIMSVDRVKDLSYKLSKKKYPTGSGNYYILFDRNSIKDAVGNKAEGSGELTTLKLQNNANPRYYVIDNDPPTCTIDKNGIIGNGGWYKERAVGIGLRRSSDTSEYNLTTSSTPSYNNVDFINLNSNTSASGIKYYGYVKDKAGNTGSCNTTVKLDKDGPTVVPTVNMRKWTEDDYDEYVDDNNYRVTSDGSRNPYSSGWYKYPVFTRPSGSSDPAGSSGFHYEVTVAGDATHLENAEVSYKNVIANGTSYVMYRACDGAGNCSNYSQAKQILVDKKRPTRPTITKSKNDKCIVSGGNGVYITGNSSDEHSLIKYWQYKKNDVDNPEWKTYSNSATNLFYTTPFTAEYEGTASFRACDYAGNCSRTASTNINIRKSCGDNDYYVDKVKNMTNCRKCRTGSNCTKSQVKLNDKCGNVVAHIYKGSDNKIVTKSDHFEVTVHCNIFQGPETHIDVGYTVTLECPACMSGHKKETLKPERPDVWGKGSTHEKEVTFWVPAKSGKYDLELEGNSDDPNFDIDFKDIIIVKKK